jgi:hypothetical protein
VPQRIDVGHHEIDVTEETGARTMCGKNHGPSNRFVW